MVPNGFAHSWTHWLLRQEGQENQLEVPLTAQALRKVRQGCQVLCTPGRRQGIAHSTHSCSICVQKTLAEQIHQTQGRCGQSLFIFDEAEKLHPSLLEALRPHLERQHSSAPNTIFLFLR